MKIIMETPDVKSKTIVLYDDEKDIGMVSILIGNMRFRIDEKQFAGSNTRYLDVNLEVDRGSDTIVVTPRSANVVFLTAEDQYR